MFSMYWIGADVTITSDSNSIAQSSFSGILLLKEGDDVDDKLVLFMGIDGVKFRKPVVPGDQLVMELTMLKARRSTFKMAGKSYVQGELVCEAEMMAAVVDR